MWVIGEWREVIGRCESFYLRGEKMITSAGDIEVAP